MFPCNGGVIQRRAATVSCKWWNRFPWPALGLRQEEHLATATGLAAGTHTVTITDERLRQPQRRVTITAPSAITVSMWVAQAVQAATERATVTASGGTGTMLTYAIHPGGTSATSGERRQELIPLLVTGWKKKMDVRKLNLINIVEEVCAWISNPISSVLNSSINL